MLKLLNEVRNEINADLRKLFDPHGITISQWDVISTVHACGPILMGDISKRTMIMPPSLSRILTALLRKKLVLIKNSKDGDRRKTELIISKAGERLIDNLKSEYIAIAVLPKDSAAVRKLYNSAVKAKLDC